MRAEQVPFLAVHFRDQRGLGQAGPDGGGDLARRDAARERQRLAVGQGDVDIGRGSGRGHGFSPVREKARPSGTGPRQVKRALTNPGLEYGGSRFEWARSPPLIAT